MAPLYFLAIIVILAICFFFAWRAARRIEIGDRKSQIQQGILLSIQLPKENEKLPVAAEQMFASLHGLLRFTPDAQEHISLEMASSVDGLRFYVYTPTEFKSFVESQIYAQYPTAEIREAVDYTKSIGDNSHVAASEITLSKDFIFPIKTFRDFEVDPLAAITSALSSLGNSEQLWLQILVRPVDDFWQDRGHEYVKLVREGTHPVSINPQDIIIDVGKQIVSVGANIFPYIAKGPTPVDPHPGPVRTPPPPRLSAGQELELKMIENKLSKIGFETKIRAVAVAQSEDSARQKLGGILGAFKQFTTANLNGFIADSDSPSSSAVVTSFQQRSFPEKESGDFILDIEELASIFHLPNLSVETPTISWTRAKKGEPPLNLPTENATLLGETMYRDLSTRFGIKKADRRKHMYLIGKTGVGKSTLIKNMIIQDMRNGEGVAVLDPHGQLIEELLEFVPENRIDDVVIFNPADADYPVSLNMLEMVDPRQRTLMADSLVDVFKKYFANSWGPRLEYILKNCILTLLEVPNTSLLSITRLLTDKDYRKFIVDKINDPQMKAFWRDEYARMEQNERLITEAISPIQNKVGQFLNSELIRNIVGQAKSTIKVDDIINRRKLFFVNLASGRIGANNTSLLGAMIVSQLQFAAMRRVDIPEQQRVDFFLYADEFQSFATESFAVILSEARKYRLDLTITHQYIEQMPEEVRDAIFGNVGTLICFGVGNQDAHFLEREFSPVFLENDFINLGRFEMYLKLQIDDFSSTPFSARSLAPYTDATNLHERAVQISRMNYSRPVERVEKMIKKWTETKFRLGQPPLLPAWAVEEEKQALISGREIDSPVEGEVIPTLETTTPPTEQSLSIPVPLQEQQVRLETIPETGPLGVPEVSQTPVSEPAVSPPLPVSELADSDQEEKVEKAPSVGAQVSQTNLEPQLPAPADLAPPVFSRENTGLGLGQSVGSSGEVEIFRFPIQQPSQKESESGEILMPRR
ncbi:MAG: type IV secretion system DNA-binding domain-containing protein [bacterium]|nr:type IV secretion system DNA-binding domain-containing protein [bacterium]